MLAGGGALQFAFEVDDVAAVVADVRRRGVVMRDPAAGSIRYPSGNTAAWVDEGPGWRPFFIRYPTQHSDRFAIRNPRITQIMLDGTEGPVGDVFGVRYERMYETH